MVIPAEGRIGNGFFDTMKVEGKLDGIAEVKVGVELCELLGPFSVVPCACSGKLLLALVVAMLLLMMV